VEKIREKLAKISLWRARKLSRLLEESLKLLILGKRGERGAQLRAPTSEVTLGGRLNGTVIIVTKRPTRST